MSSLTCLQMKRKDRLRVRLEKKKSYNKVVLKTVVW